MDTKIPAIHFDNDVPLLEMSSGGFRKLRNPPFPGLACRKMLLRPRFPAQLAGFRVVIETLQQIFGRRQNSHYALSPKGRDRRKRSETTGPWREAHAR